MGNIPPADVTKVQDPLVRPRNTKNAMGLYQSSRKHIIDKLGTNSSRETLRLARVRKSNSPMWQFEIN